MSLLQQLIEHLTPAERRQADEWLACPLHNKREDVRRCYAGRRHGLPDPETEFAAVYGPDEPYDAAKLRQVEHQTLSRLEDFVAWKFYRKDEYARDLHLLHAYGQRQLADLHRTRLRRYRPSPTSSSGQLAFEYRHAKDTYEQEIEVRRGPEVDYQTQELALERYVLALKLRQACETLGHQRLVKEAAPFEIPRLAATLAAAARPENAREPIIRLYYLAAILQLRPLTDTHAEFSELIEGLKSHAARFPLHDERNLLLLALNHGLRSANSGREAAIGITLDLYRFGLDRGSLFDRSKLTPFSFNNIIGLAIRLGETSWAADFLAGNQHRLPRANRGEIVALSQARLAFATGDDGTALFHLQQSDFQDFIHHLTARTIQLKIYFRQDSYQLQQSHISSTLRLLSRRKNVGYHPRNYNNIFRLAQRIVRLPPGDKAAVDELRERIMTTEPCTERPWLLRQI